MATDISISNIQAVPVIGDGLRAFSLPSPAKAQPPAEPPRELTLDQAVRELGRSVAEQGTELNFRIDKDSGRVIVSVVDPKDGTVLRQIPSEEVMRLARTLSRGASLLIEAQA